MEARSVSGPDNVLLVDMGNTGIKYALCADANTSLEICRADSVDELGQYLKGVARLLVASVGNTERVERLVNLANSHGIEAEQCTSQAESFGIRCAYDNVGNLGVDRWLAVLAARKLTDANVAVIDAGTAITCDFVIGQRHMGGWIAPGMRVMRDAITANTAFVFSDEQRVKHSAVGEDTPACLNQGCLAAAQGILLSAERELRKYGQAFCIIVSGGDQDCFAELAGSEVFFEENVVLSGLQRFI